ncbi:7-cyano-7-deazaguanine synthase [Tamaricihabitans halophyticus]|uniref:7-cyano-7-deazaguanine synthase n=1 Tax=Tamaricihabitans halophyticus TaxID=1262583 RepID=UPI001404C883|nr:7-cyano-7-deazaguanine synthase [Tamaricihabitans halophyticus]
MIDPDLWTDAILALINRTLQVMSGDVWRIEVRGGATSIDSKYRLLEVGQISELTLFSGGLDSGSYAAERVANGARGLLLIAHDHADSASTQQTLANAIDQDRRVTRLAQVRDEPKRAAGVRLESSTRTRGFLFVATAIYVASGYGLPEVAIPENGLVAVNPPLSPDRIGSNSTRSTHPWVLERLNEVLRTIGGDIVIRNPYLLLTKGEVCTRARDAGVSPQVIASTVSCGQAPQTRKDFANCGYCYPCLVRRAGLQAAYDQDPTIYQRDLTQLKSKRQRQHLDDVARWLSRSFNVRDLIADMPTPTQPSPRALLPVIKRSQAELRDLVLEHSDRNVPGQRCAHMPGRAPTEPLATEATGPGPARTWDPPASQIDRTAQ